MLDKAALKADIKAAYEYEATQEISPEESRDRIAQKMADAIEKYVKSGDGKYQAGTLTAGATPVTSVGTNATIKIT